MEKEQRSAALHIILYALSGVVVGSAVGGTLLYKVMTQDTEPVAGAADSAGIVTESAIIDTTTSVTTTTAVTEPPLDADTVRRILQPADSLFTETYYYTDSDRFENHSEVFGKRVPFTSSAVILTYSGTVTLAVETDAIAYAVDPVTKQIVVTLPEPALRSYEIDTDSVRCYDVQNALFSEPTTGDYLVQLAQKQDEICDKVMESQQMRKRFLAQMCKVVEGILAAATPAADYTVQVVLPPDPAPAQTTSVIETTVATETTTTTEEYFYEEPRRSDEPEDDFRWFLW